MISFKVPADTVEGSGGCRYNQAMTRTPRGFSVLEALVAGFVLTVILMTVLDLLPASLLAVGRSRHTVVANALARSILEGQRASGFSNFDHTPALTPVIDDNTTFTPLFEVVDVSAQANPARVKGIRVTVTWTEHSRLRSVSQELWESNVP